MAALRTIGSAGPPEDVLQILLNTSGGSCQKWIRDVFRTLGRNWWAPYNINDEHDLEMCLRNYPQLFRVRGDGRNKYVTPRINLAVCSEHSKVSGSCQEMTCADLHFCIFYLLSGSCSFNGRCLFGHDLETAHNRRLLEEHRLRGLNMTELRTLFRLPGVRRGVTVPKVCRYYNVKNGCTKGQNCRSLHMCRSYVLGECKFGSCCRRNHDFDDPQVTHVLNLYGVEVTGRPHAAILKEVRTYENEHSGNSNTPDGDSDEDMMRSRHAAGIRPMAFGSDPRFNRDSSSPMEPDGTSGSLRQRSNSAPRHASRHSETPYRAVTRDHAANEKLEEICLFHLKGNCRFGRACNRLHSSEPFQWRFTVRDEVEAGQEVTWRGLDSENNMLLEQKFSQPHITKCTVDDTDGSKMEVNFEYFTAVNSRYMLEYRVRRLSTPSGVDPSCRPSVVQQPTVWLWYWRNQDGEWNEFGSEIGEVEHLPLRSDTVEQNYLMSGNTPLNFGHFKLDFRRMRLEDLHTGRKFKVRRRPQFQLRHNRAELEDRSSDRPPVAWRVPYDGPPELDEDIMYRPLLGQYQQRQRRGRRRRRASRQRRLQPYHHGPRERE